jgi:hypothetical protein
MTRILNIIIIFLLYACNNQPVNNRQEIKPDINGLVKSIEQSDCYYGKVVGLAGKEPSVYAAFENLDKIVTDSFWLHMSHSTYPVMRLYSYRALESRNQEMASQVRERLKEDTAIVCWRANDMEDSCPVKELMPTDK